MPGSGVGVGVSVGAVVGVNVGDAVAVGDTEGCPSGDGVTTEVTAAVGSAESPVLPLHAHSINSPKINTASKNLLRYMVPPCFLFATLVAVVALNFNP